MTDLRKTTGLGSGTFLASGGSVDGSGAGWPIDKYGNQLTNAQIEQRQAIEQAEKQFNPDWDQQAVLVERIRELEAQLYGQAEKQAATIEDNSQDWAKLDGAVAWHLIERHANNWADVGKMMDEYLAAKLAKTEQEPVAWRWLYNGKPDSHKCFDGKGPDADVILRAASSVMPRTVQYFYTAPPSKPWVSLTDDEIWLKTRDINRDEKGWGIKFARAIEAKLKEKNN